MPFFTILPHVPQMVGGERFLNLTHFQYVYYISLFSSEDIFSRVKLQLHTTS